MYKVIKRGKRMTHNDKKDVISVCNILADKMSDSGKVAVQQIIGAVEDMVENEPCEDAISRAALLEELGEEPFNWNDSPEEFQEVRDYQWFRSLVENAPSVIPKQKVGKWIRSWCEWQQYLECSKCGYETGLRCDTNYCPNCGCRMEVNE